MDSDSFDWDELNIRHIAEHRVSPEEVEQCLLNDPVHVEVQIDEKSGEERMIEIGHTNKARILLIVWTRRAGRIRPVTAFPADRATRQTYMTERFGKN